MPTPHIQAECKDFAETVLMPGDPLRAKFVAENFLTNAVNINNVRGMLAFTGEYNGKKVSVMGSGMGMPSIGIYSYELFKHYGVNNIIRIGSCGAYSQDIHIRDVILSQGACTDSNYAYQYALNGTFAPIADFDLLRSAYEAASNMKIKVTVGNVLSSDVFYKVNDNWKRWADMGVLAVEMETAALYMNAAYLNKKALSILTVSDHFIYDEYTTSQERETTFADMIKIALAIA